MVFVFDKGIVKLRFSKYPAQTPPQHPQKQPRVHFADAHVVGEGVEVGHAVGGVLHGRFNPNRLDAAPVQADEDFRVEIHAVAHGFFADDRKRGGSGYRRKPHIPSLMSYDQVCSMFQKSVILRPYSRALGASPPYCGQPQTTVSGFCSAAAKSLGVSSRWCCPSASTCKTWL